MGESSQTTLNNVQPGVTAKGGDALQVISAPALCRGRCALARTKTHCLRVNTMTYPIHSDVMRELTRDIGCLLCKNRRIRWPKRKLVKRFGKKYSDYAINAALWRLVDHGVIEFLVDEPNTFRGKDKDWAERRW